jgi:hypothetical protein
MKRYAGGISWCLYRQASDAGQTTAIVFPPGLQLFVPFAQKDARLALGANQSAAGSPEILELKA